MNVKFSILVPLYNTPSDFLQDMIESVKNQQYKKWELCLADASDNAHAYVGEIVSGYAQSDVRIKYIKLKDNKGISENTNACIELSTGNYFALLDHDDVLDKKALKEVARVIHKKRADFIYTDEAKFTNAIENWFSPNYKPDFSKYELRSHNYICHLTVYSRELLEQVGYYRKEFDGSQDHDMVLRLSEKAQCIVHIPKVLYYWRVHGESVSAGVENKSYAIDAAKKAVEEHVLRCGENGKVVTHAPFSLLYHVLYELKGNPCITIVLYGDASPAALKRCIESVEDNAGYTDYKYLIFVPLDKQADYQEIMNSLEDIHEYYLRTECPYEDIQEINKILMQYGNDYMLFLNFNSRIESNGFVTELLVLAQREDVGFVGPKVYSRDGVIKSAGIALTEAAKAAVINRFYGELTESDGYEAGLRHIRHASALSETCVMIGMDKFKTVGGFSSRWKWYKGIDICLRLMQKSYSNVWTPYAQIIDFESDTLPTISERNQFVNYWKKLYSKEDPYYSKFLRYDLDNIHDKNTPAMLWKKGVQYLRDEGISGLMGRINVYKGGNGVHTSQHMTYVPQTPITRAYKDVLFINGCAPSVPHPPRYRVTHQREQLAANNISNDEVYYENLDLDLVRYYRAFIIFRCPYIEIVGEFIKKARELNKPVLYDIDDLVIDTKYTDTIPFVSRFDPESKKGYDDGVIRMGKSMKLCDAVITTTEGMAKELANYVPETFINRNTASERMVELSEKAIFKRDVLPAVSEKALPKWLKRQEYLSAKKAAEERKRHGIRIGYFSGSITHSDDFQMIMPAIMRILKEKKDVELHIVGELDLPEELHQYKGRFVAAPFTKWQGLPDLIASVDINLAPVTESIFNEAKSENKWVEAALVKVPTVASNIGAFKHMIEQNETGLLCETEEEWYQAIKLLIDNCAERKRLAENAYHFVKENCVTIHTGRKLAEYIRSKFVENVAFVLPSTNISGGVLVALRHMKFLKERGYDVFIVNEDRKNGYFSFEEEVFPVLSMKDTLFEGIIDNCVATMWKTLDFLEKNRRIKRCYYLVQNYETDFYEPNNPLRIRAEQTYWANFDVSYLTISKWCKDWLMERYDKKALYMPNGIDSKLFFPVERKFDGKIRILIEGDSSVDYKNVDESFRIVEKLDKDKYEVWYLSYNGTPKEWYNVDRFLNRVPYEQVADIYRDCHILLKSSILESFSYPPLEMMATGGFVVVAPNGGNKEFLHNEENCLLYPLGDLDAAVAAIERIDNDQELRMHLFQGGINTASEREWENVKSKIVNCYMNETI